MQDVANGYCQAPCMFDQGCLYYPGSVRGMPMFRIAESADLNCDSFGEGVYIDNRLDGLCSTDCHCRQFGPLDFAFIVSKSPAGIEIEIRNKALENVLIDVMGPDKWCPKHDWSVWNGADLLARYHDLEARLKAVVHSPVRSVEAQSFLPLRLLMDGFLAQEYKLSLTTPRHMDLGDVLEDVLPEEHHNDMLERKLFAATSEDNIEVVQDLLSKGVNVHAFDPCGNTSLIYAAIFGHLSIAEALVANGADIAWVNNEGETALHKAAKEKHMSLVSFLIEKGADIHAGDISGSTPLHTWSVDDFQQLVRKLHSRRVREGVLVPSEPATSDIDDMWFKGAGNGDISIDDYRDLSYKPNSQAQMKNTHEAKMAMRGFFIRQYCKVRQHKIFDRVQGRFPNSTRAWGYGMEALHKISYGYLPQELGMVMAVLCVCKAVVATLQTHDTSHSQSYESEFERDLPRWTPLFHGSDRVLFEAAAWSIWELKWYMWETPSFLDYHALFQQAERLTSHLVEEVGRLFSLPTFAKQGTLGQVRQRPSRKEHPPPKDHDPGGPGIGAESAQHERTTTGRRTQPRKSCLWAELMTGAIFSMLLIFLRCLYDLEMVTPVALNAEKPHTSADAQSVAPGSVDKSRLGLPPFKCLKEGCDQRFTRKDNRNRHYKDCHSPPKACVKCKKEYRPRCFQLHKCKPKKKSSKHSKKTGFETGVAVEFGPDEHPRGFGSLQPWP
ncbi:hypothetical protein CEP51_010748 [Fusarium floridanum]|uniref:C2H2-type domain-containing protein n=1 Tax=Fusarium floridanum TaxID=1325733 RepID=A0A428RDF5_9HYPO|nr:hypothetical protein CEP51_010748 [Fusarium floridanum]